MKAYPGTKIFIYSILFALISTICPAEKVSVQDETVVIAFSAERRGEFLSEPGNVPIEFLRRAGREINKNWPGDKTQLQAASLFSLKKIAEKDFLRPRPFIDLSADKKKEAAALLDRYASEAESLLDQIKLDDKCFYMRMVAESEPVISLLNSLIENDHENKRISQDQIEKIKYQLLPVLESSNYLIGAAVLSYKGFEAKFRICSLEKKLADPKISHKLSIAKFVNPDSLMVFAQTHPIEDPAQIMAELQKIPQTATVISMVASAGLDFEKDLLSNGARESILYINLEPDGENSVPDIRFVAPVPDVKKLEGNLDKLKTLCMQTGVFIKNLEGKQAGVRLSHFMFPQYGVFTALFDRFLVLATSEQNLLEEIEFLQKAIEGKIDSETVEEGVQRYWRISFEDFNLQLQKLLQSPLMADKGVPPIPNLNLLDDLGALKVLTRLQPDRIDFSIHLPIKENKEK